LVPPRSTPMEKSGMEEKIAELGASVLVDF
jgi:hypothetical protein